MRTSRLAAAAAAALTVAVAARAGDETIRVRTLDLAVDPSYATVAGTADGDAVAVVFDLATAGHARHRIRRDGSVETAEVPPDGSGLGARLAFDAEGNVACAFRTTVVVVGIDGTRRRLAAPTFPVAELALRDGRVRLLEERTVSERRIEWVVETLATDGTRVDPEPLGVDRVRSADDGEAELPGVPGAFAVRTDVSRMTLAADGGTHLAFATVLLSRQRGRSGDPALVSLDADGAPAPTPFAPPPSELPWTFRDHALGADGTAWATVTELPERRRVVDLAVAARTPDGRVLEAHVPAAERAIHDEVAYRGAASGAGTYVAAGSFEVLERRGGLPAWRNPLVWYRFSAGAGDRLRVRRRVLHVERPGPGAGSTRWKAAPAWVAVAPDGTSLVARLAPTSRRGPARVRMWVLGPDGRGLARVTVPAPDEPWADVYVAACGDRGFVALPGGEGPIPLLQVLREPASRARPARRQ